MEADVTAASLERAIIFVREEEQRHSHPIGISVKAQKKVVGMAL
jgi:hypothetical protein